MIVFMFLAMCFFSTCISLIVVFSTLRDVFVFVTVTLTASLTSISRQDIRVCVSLLDLSLDACTWITTQIQKCNKHTNMISMRIKVKF